MRHKDTITEEFDDDSFSRMSFLDESPLTKAKSKASSPISKKRAVESPVNKPKLVKEKLSHVEIERLKKVKEKLLNPTLKKKSSLVTDLLNYHEY